MHQHVGILVNYEIIQIIEQKNLLISIGTENKMDYIEPKQRKESSALIMLQL